MAHCFDKLVVSVDRCKLDSGAIGARWARVSPMAHCFENFVVGMATSTLRRAWLHINMLQRPRGPLQICLEQGLAR